MSLHGRTYTPDTPLYARKFAAWNESVTAIHAHAARVANGAQLTYTLGLNAFADWTDEEFKQAYLSKMDMSASKYVLLGNSRDVYLTHTLTHVHNTTHTALQSHIHPHNTTHTALQSHSKEDYPPFINPEAYWHLPYPDTLDWRDADIVGPVKDQHANASKCGCCWAFATVAITEMVNAQYTGKVGCVNM